MYKASAQEFKYTLNPALIFVIIFFSFVSVFVLINFSSTNFAAANVFTLLWTWLLLLLLHGLINFKKFISLFTTGKKNIILNSFLQVTFLYMPYLVIAFLYDNWILIQQVSSEYIVLIDQQLKIIDEFIFGIQPTIFLEKLLHPIAVEIFMIAYSMFFIYPFFYLIWLLQKNELILFQKVLFAQNIAIATSLICFILLPAKGPRVHLGMEYSIPLEGVSSEILYELSGSPSFFHMQRDLWNYLERVKTDCMPSMHAGLCLLCLFYALKNKHLFNNRKLASRFWIIGIGLLIISTVYLRYHWVIDVIVGMALSILIYYSTELIFNRWISNPKRKIFKEINVPWVQ